ncbi:hypothetical protein NUSPORA_00393 [Nucleospora cyclopteri]
MTNVRTCALQLLEQSSPVLTVIGAIISTSGFIEKGFEPYFLAIVLPVFITSCIPSLIANCAFPLYRFNFFSVGLQVVGIFLGCFLHNQRVLLRIIGDLPIASKITGYIALAMRKESTKDVISWVIINELMGIVVRKFLLKKQIRIRLSEGLNVFVCVFALYLVRVYDMHENILILAVFFVPLGKMLKRTVVYSLGRKETMNINVATVKTSAKKENKDEVTSKRGRSRKIKVD